MSNLKDQKAVEENPSQIYNFRMTLTSPNLKLLEKVCTDFIKSAQDKKIKSVTGPVRLPTRTLRITTRKTPCGEGSKTWDRYQMRIYKRIIDLKQTSSDIVRQVTSVGIYTNVDCVVTISS